MAGDQYNFLAIMNRYRLAETGQRPVSPVGGGMIGFLEQLLAGSGVAAAFAARDVAGLSTSHAAACTSSSVLP